MIRLDFRRVPLPDCLTLALLAAWPLVTFLPVTLGSNVWFTTDVIRLFHPFAVELARALNQGRLPLWTPGILSGLPLLAEGQVGALYPLNWFLLKLLPEHVALSYSVLIHLVWIAWGMYFLLRDFSSSRPAGILAALVVTSSGFVFGHLSHSSVIATMAWLPWMIIFQRGWQHSRAPVWLLLVTLACAVQFLTGSIQVAFLNTLAFVFFGLASELGARNEPATLQQRAFAYLVSTVLPLGLAAGLAAIQLVPTAELIRYSVRQATTTEFATSYSLSPDSLMQIVSPFSQGEPAETNGEFWAYIGLTPLCLAIIALVFRRDRAIVLIVGFVLVTTLFALGGSTPIYRTLLNLPVFGLFRVPARYMHLAIFGASILAAMGLDHIAKRLPRRRVPTPVWIIVSALVVGSLAIAKMLPPEMWLGMWRWLPAVLAVALVALLARALPRRLSGGSFAVLVLGLAAVDFAFYAPPFLATIDALTPSSYVTGAPRSLAELGQPGDLYRTYTDLSTFPSVPALRGSLFPNTALAFDRQSAQGYTSLALAGQAAFSFDPSPAMLDLMNVRYLAIPLEPRPDNKRSTPNEALGLDVADNEMQIPPTPATRIVLSTYTEQADQLPRGTVVTQLRVRLADAQIVEFPIRAGAETEDWDIERKNGASPVSTTATTVAHDLTGFWRSYGRQFAGHTYAAQFDLPAPAQVVGIEMASVQAKARLGIESILLESADGSRRSLAQLVNRNEFALRYMSDTVAIWENLSVLPRAFVAHAVIVADGAAASALLREPGFRPANTVILDRPQSAGTVFTPGTAADRVRITSYHPERVEIQVNSGEPGYLVLCDSWYPGWQASVDGQPIPIERADLVFRAVPIGAGAHLVVFEYRPQSLLLGAAITMASFAVLFGVFMWIRRKVDLLATGEQS